MTYRVWYSTESFADFVIANTSLQTKNLVKKKMYESDANNSTNFHTMPDHIKGILYLDAPDLIVEIDSEPIFSIEVTTEAGTGHNAFQRFARLSAAVENDVPAFYIYPEAVIVTRQNANPRWDKINPLIFKALEEVMNIYDIPALLYYFPSDFRAHPQPNNAPHSGTKGLIFDANLNFGGSPNGTSVEMQSMFAVLDEIIQVMEANGIIRGRSMLLRRLPIRQQRAAMNAEYVAKGGAMTMSPLSATVKVPTAYLLKHLSKYEKGAYQIGELLRSRDETIIYKINATFRGDPYPGAIAAIDYLLCRQGKSFEERRYNLVLAWGDMTIDNENQTLVLQGNHCTVNDFVRDVKASENKNILSKNYTQIRSHEIPRYYMQVRYGSTFSKSKHIRVYSYFADAILFPDGALWRDA